MKLCFLKRHKWFSYENQTRFQYRWCEHCHRVEIALFGKWHFKFFSSVPPAGFTRDSSVISVVDLWISAVVKKRKTFTCNVQLVPYLDIMKSRLRDLGYTVEIQNDKFTVKGGGNNENC